MTLPEGILAFSAMTATATAFKRENLDAYIEQSYSASGRYCPQRPLSEMIQWTDSPNEGAAKALIGAEGIISDIGKLLIDETAFETGEPRPSAKAVTEISSLLREAEKLGAEIPKAEVSNWYGELDVTWKHGDRLLRIVCYSDAKDSLLYFQSDSGGALTRGESIRPATSNAIYDRLKWLFA